MRITIGGTLSSHVEREITIVNAGDRSWTKHRYVLWFGAYGDTNLMAYANSLADALDECVDWIAEYAPGHLADTAVAEAYKEAVEESFAADPEEPEEEREERAREIAECDTPIAGNEGNYLNSWEWGIALDNPTRAELFEFCGTFDAEYVKALRKCERAPGDTLAKRGRGFLRSQLYNKEWHSRQIPMGSSLKRTVR